MPSFLCNYRVHFLQVPIEAIDLHRGDLIVSAHGCGALTDTVLERAVAAGARVAVLPCCHDLSVSDTGGVEGWMDGPLAVDATRAANLNAAGYTLSFLGDRIL